MKVELKSVTPNSEALIEEAGRICYRSESTGTPETRAEFIAKLIRSGHESVLEHGVATFFVSGVSRALSHQLVRHRLASYCLSGDTVVFSDYTNREVTKRTIKDLYNMKQQYIDMISIRCVDEKTNKIVKGKIKKVIFSGDKPVLQVTTASGYTIKSTKDHRFNTVDGWKRLEEISVGDKLYVNGVSGDLYKNEGWLDGQYNGLDRSQEEIGDLCGVSKHTVRSWIRRFGLQKEIGSWCIGKEPPNKGMTKDIYSPSMATSLKMKGRVPTHDMSGENNPNYKEDPEDLTNSGGYTRSHKAVVSTGLCEACLSEGRTEIHHKDRNPKNSDQSNLEELCIGCHKMSHKGPVVKYVKLDKVVSIVEAGTEATYDIEMVGPHHNFVADGFVVHNSQESQRYVDQKEFKTVVPPSIQKDPITLNIFNSCMDEIAWRYNLLIELGVPKEDARFLLPNATETKLAVTMNFRVLRNFFKLRLDRHAQWEIRCMSNKMLWLITDEAPNVFKDFLL